MGGRRPRPQGLLFPWGQDAAAVDLDTPGSRPAGSVTANLSPVGARDTVGSAWEWVDEPYEPVDPGQQVRRGGENGRVRGGAAMRQVVDQANESTIRETGFRCAADAVDPAVPFGQFTHEQTRPETSTTRPGSAASPPTAPGGALVDDRFEDPRSGWPERTDASSKVGYHVPTSYHVEPAQAGTGVVALGGYSYADAIVETAAYVDKVASPTGRFRYGLVFRAHGARRAPLSQAGPERPENFYAFVVDPRGGSWELLHEDVYPLRRVAGGPLPGPLRVSDPAQPDVLRAELRGSALALFVNGASVGTYDTRGYHLEGDLGLYVEALDEPKPHVHFDRFTVSPRLTPRGDAPPVRATQSETGGPPVLPGRSVRSAAARWHGGTKGDRQWRASVQRRSMSCERRWVARSRCPTSPATTRRRPCGTGHRPPAHGDRPVHDRRHVADALAFARSWGSTSRCEVAATTSPGTACATAG